MLCSEEYSNGSSCLGLDLQIDNSMGTLLFEFPSVRADVWSYQCCLKEDNPQPSLINPGDHPDNKKNNSTESIQMEEFYPLDRITLSVPPVSEEELCVEPEMVETTAIEKAMDGILTKLEESFSLLPGEENLWFLVGDGLHEGIDRDFEKLVCEILDFNPFGQ
ncbi:hypothetical protein PNOK_0023100 [Pyrrhoderma noxium]|uniref:Uncharacterized protein n=1 Tax=Pyrrhoderma noxium TaxID=2282107 RepID=A0A286UU93_9AGAM|nr:hypothetical protein PNOK_0023100 [Pyrrhoderma noxium]